MGAGPADDPASSGGRRREVNVREVLNAIFYVLSTGCQWRACRPAPEGPAALISFCVDRTSVERVRRALLRAATREREGREASPTAAIIDSKAPKRLERDCRLDPQGFDPAKKVTGRKRHILVDTLGLLLNVVVHSAAMQDQRRRSARPQSGAHAASSPSSSLFSLMPGTGAEDQAAIAKTGTWKLTMTSAMNCIASSCFQTLDRRQKVAAWMSHSRRLARKLERYARSAASVSVSQ